VCLQKFQPAHRRQLPQPLLRNSVNTTKTLPPKGMKPIDAAFLDYREGRLTQAKTVCDAVLKEQPDGTDALYLLGLIALQQDDVVAASDFFQRALKLDPNNLQVWIGLAELFRLTNQWPAAEESYRKVIALDPHNVGARINLSSILLAQQRFEDVISILEEALHLRSDLPAAFLNLGVAFKAAGDLERARTAYENVLALDPDLPEAHYNLATILAEIHPDQSINSYNRTISLRPDWAEAYNGLGVVLQNQGKLDDAIANYQQAATLTPQWFLPYHNLAETFIAQGKPERAVEYFKKSIACEPGFAISHFDLATQLLQLGSFTEGWREYEWRWDNEGRIPKREGFDVPVWDGSQLDGRTVLIWSEQGFGDVIQFVRYVPLIQQRGAKVWLQTDHRLTRLMQTCSGLSMVVIDDQSIGSFDFQIPLMSLPHIFGTTLETIPQHIPYLSAPPCDHPDLTALKATTSGLRIGIAWESGASYLNHEWRDCSPAHFQRLSRIPGVSLYSLQFGNSKERAEGYPELQITDLSRSIGDFGSTAAFVDALDLIITVDTAMAHLAGALGKPVWTLLNQRCDWRWMLGRNDSPWYPTMTLFRQVTFGDWSSVFREVEQTLRREVLK
jgi:tetratricopeptide (TPR) repeat protein